MTVGPALGVRSLLTSPPLLARRFGRLDVLNPEHCDFLPLKQAILSNANLLRDTTRLDKYESYRTQRLLQRRATRQLPKATRDSILHEVAAL